MPTRFLINQCQIITFLILKSDIIENSRIELRGIVLPVPSNQIKVALSVYYYFTLQLGTIVIFPVSYRNLRKNVGGLLEGAKGYVAPPLSNYWGGGACPPPSSYAYDEHLSLCVCASFPFGFEIEMWDLILLSTVELQWLEHLWDHEN